MIVQMKKITIVVQGKDREEALSQLSSLGLVHVEYLSNPAGQSINEVHEDIHMISRALEIIPSGDEGLVPKQIENWGKVADTVLDLRDYRGKLMERRRKCQGEIDRWADWGDFDVSLIRHLSVKGIQVYLCEVPVKELKNIPGDAVVQIVSRKGGIVRCAIASDKEMKFSFKMLDLPGKRFSDLIREQKENEEQIKLIDEQLKDFVPLRNGLEEIRQHLEKELEFEKAHVGMGNAGKLSYLTGYCPVPKISELEDASKKFKWALLMENPAEEDIPPTLITNPKWVNLIKPVFDIINTIPGYREVDISTVFLLFFSIFFGILIGDAGYGALIFIATAFVQFKFGKAMKDKSPLFLMYVLGIMTVIWGLLTGTIFGKEWLPQTVKPMMPWLAKGVNIQVLCLFIGAFHLSIAHVWRAVKKAPSVLALSEVGWIGILWGMFFLARTLIAGTKMPFYALWFLGVGLVFVLVFTIHPKYFFKGLFLRLVTHFFSVLGSFTDIVSYIRLFAVGTASVAVADAFNKMAAQVGYSNILIVPITAVILLIGHGLNITLGALAILVHGVRLNVLEFSSHMGLEWSGVEYNPFKGKKTDLNNTAYKAEGEQ